VQAAQVLLHCSTGLGNAKYVIVVDDDVDPTDLDQVMWAVVTRSDPSTALTLVAGLPTSPLDPSNAEGQSTMTRLIIDACRPIRSRAAYPAVLETPGTKVIAALKEKWPELQRCMDSGRE
jgi:4-hydroxy-3-polyprenylbenzoate decarboxylase